MTTDSVTQEQSGTLILQRDVDAMDELDDDKFRDIVAKRIEDLPANKTIWRILRHHTIIDRTAGCLEEIAEELQEEIAVKGFRPGHFKAKRLTLVTHRLNQLSRAGSTGDFPAEDPLPVLQSLVRRLALAIDAHRRECIRQELSPEPHDVALWDVLDALTLPANGRERGPTPAELIAAGHWRHAEANDEVSS